MLIAALAALAVSALASGWTHRLHGRQQGALPGLTGFLAVLLIVQAALLIALAITIRALARRAREARASTRPYLGGNLATLVAALGFSLGGLLTAVINFGVTRLLGTAEPSGFQFMPSPSDALAVPWPVFAFGAAPVGLLAGAIVAGIILYRGYRRPQPVADIGRQPDPPIRPGRQRHGRQRPAQPRHLDSPGIDRVVQRPVATAALWLQRQLRQHVHPVLLA